MSKLFTFRSVRSKMLFGFSLVLLLVLALSLYIFNVLKNSNETVDDILHTELPLLIADEQLATNMYNRIGLARAFVLSGDKKYKALFDTATEESITIQNLALELNPSDELQELLENTIAWREYIEDDVFAEYEKGNTDQALTNLLTTEQYITPLIEGYKQLATNREAHIINLETGVLTNGKTTILIVSVVSLVVILVSLMIAIITSRSITKPLSMVMKRMELVADGKLNNEPLETKLKDEIGQLVHSTNQMTESTRNVLLEINEVSRTVSTQSEELTQSSIEVTDATEQVAVITQELASGSESLARNATDLTATMNMFTTKVQEANHDGEFMQQAFNDVIDMTKKGSNLMQSSTEQMKRIDQIVHEAVDKVEGLDHDTQEISQLVSVIQNVAEQTNLLALNAAIEAARAGEHGKGFAVVADEVRKLAEQSSNSVKNITDIVDRIQAESSEVSASLQESYKEVTAGSNQIATTGQTFNEITTAVAEMVNRIHHISENLNDIFNSTQSINSSIEEIAATAEESAAGSEETSASTEQTNSAMQEVAASSEELAKLADDLNHLVKRFDV